MHLSDYLNSTDGDRVTASDLARMLGVSHSTISRLANKKAEPSADMLRKLHKATSGKVTPDDMLGVGA